MDLSTPATPTSNFRTEVVPGFAIIGAARAGTTSLARWLNQHPQVQVSTVKETNFFCRAELGTAGPGDKFLNTLPVYLPNGSIEPAHVALIDSWESYRACYPRDRNVRIQGEASVSYAFYPQAARRLAEANPACRIIYVIREPVARAYSNYQFFRKLRFEHLSFREAIAAEAKRLAAGFQFCWAYTGLSRYRAAIRNFLQYFPEDQIHVARFEDLVEACCIDAWESLLRFLEVDTSFEPIRIHLNDTKLEQAEEPLKEDDAAYLTTILKEEVRFHQDFFAEPRRRSSLREFTGFA